MSYFLFRGASQCEFSEVFFEGRYITVLFCCPVKVSSGSKPAWQCPGRRGAPSPCLFSCKTKAAAHCSSSLEKGLMAGEPQGTLFSGRLQSSGPPTWNQHRINFSRGKFRWLVHTNKKNNALCHLPLTAWPVEELVGSRLENTSSRSPQMLCLKTSPLRKSSH